MWNRILGKSNGIEKNPRRSETQRSTPRRSESLKSTASTRKITQLEERDRGFNPTSTSYSSTTRNQHPGTASASIGSSFATAFNDPTSDSYLPPGLVRNASLADQIPKSSGDAERGFALGPSRALEGEKEEASNMDSKRDRKERRGTRERDDNKRGSKHSRDKKSRRDSEGRSQRGMSTDETAYRDIRRSSRAVTAADPLDQPPPQSSHVQDQFPGQFPTYSATPYRPPLAANEGGPGLAAEYYGDAGQSVADQPGHRIQSPSLIVGAEPHLQAASAVAAPPPEPSASGGVGAAASFFDGNFNAGSDIENHHGQKPASTGASSVPQYSSAMPPSTTYTISASGHTNHHSASEPVIPILGAAATGAAAGYYMSNHPSKPERPVHATPSIAGHGSMAGSLNYQQSAGTHDQYASQSSFTRPQGNPGKHSFQAANGPLYAAGAAGLAAATYHHNHQDSPTQHPSNGQHYAGNSMAQQYRHRHDGPLSKLVDFFKDREGVAQFEEYTEYIGVCRYCFAPGSSPRDAPRKHHYRRRRSHEKFGSSVRVDKDSRYSSSENESRRWKNKSWLEAGIAGYGLGKMGESLFKQDRDFGNSHSVRSGRVKRSRRRTSSSSSLERESRTSRGVVNRSTDILPRRSRSIDRVETGMTSDGRLYRKDSHGNVETSTVDIRTSRHHSRSRSRDRKSKIAKAALGAAVGSSVIAPTSRRRSRSPKKEFIRSKHGSEADSSELASVLRLHDSESHNGYRRSRRSPESKRRKDYKKEKKSRGFFSFSNGSSTSSSSSNLAFGVDLVRKSAKGTKSKKKDRESREADAALLGLGAAAAALALNQNRRPKHKGELVAVKGSKGKGKPGKDEHKNKKSSTSSEEDQWESASEGDWSSADSELAYGAALPRAHGASLPRRRQGSLSSDSSGLDRWGWRWGGKKVAKKPASDRRQSSGVDHAAGTSAAILDTAQVPSVRNRQDSKMTSSSIIPLQHVYPMPTSDPTQYGATSLDPGFPLHPTYTNARPDPVPIQHPQPVAPVSQAVYTTQSPYSHSYSAPTGQPISTQYPHPSAVPRDRKLPEGVHDQVPGAFPTGSEYFESFLRDSNKDTKSRRRDSSPVTRTSEFTSYSTGPQRRKPLKDESSSVRFDLTKEQEEKDRREERRRRKEDDKRRERRERQEIDEGKPPEHDFPDRQDTVKADEQARSPWVSTEDPPNVKIESWAAPAAAGVIAAAIGATVAAEGPSKTERKDKHSERGDYEDRDIEVIVKERHASSADAASREAEGRKGSSKEEAMSIWQAAAKLKRTSSYTDYAAYFTPPELLSKSSDVERAVGANADNDITVYQVPHVVTVEPREPRGRSPSRAYSFPITAEDLEPSKKPLPWSVPQLNLVEPTPPSSRAGSIAGSRSPPSRSPLSGEIPVIDIPLEPLESVTDGNVSYTEPGQVEYTVIEPKERRRPSVDSPTTEINIPESVPGISSLKHRSTRRESPPEAVYGDDLDFTATVAAGLQDTGFNPSIVIDNPSFRRRDSPPGSGEDHFRRGPTAIVTEITSEPEESRSPPHGFVEEIPEHHIPGSFDEDEQWTSRPHSEPQERYLESTADYDKPDHAAAELSGPSESMGANPHVYEVEPAPIETRDFNHAAFDPVAPAEERKASEREKVVEEFTEPADNARVNPQVYSAEPESSRSSKLRDVTIDPMSERQRSISVMEENTSTSPDNIDYPSDQAPSAAAAEPVSSSSGQGSKSRKKSKRRSVGFDDTPSVISAPATFGDVQDSSAKSDKARKGGIFGLFSKSTENISESKGSQGVPGEANLEDFEEPKKRSKKSKNRKSTRDDKVEAAVEAEPILPQEIEAQNDWSTSKKSRRGKEKRRSSEGATAQDSGRITQRLPAQVIAPASPGHTPLPSSSKMLTDLEDPNMDIRRDESGTMRGLGELDDLPRSHHDQGPSFLGERPEKPPLPDLPDASEDPGGQLEGCDIVEKSVPPESQSESPAKPDKQKWRLSDLHLEDRSVAYSSPSPTAVPLRPLRFGPKPSSPGLTRSLPSTPQPPITADPPFTPRRRERPCSTEFKSNEFRPIWLLEKHGSRQEPAPQESYPSLPSSHSTSRASSVHEADGFDQAQTADLIPSEFSNYQFTSGRRGLAIDTSYHEPDSELLGSQQATPTAASFQAISKEDRTGAEETSVHSERPKLEWTDVIPPADAYVDPSNGEDQDERLLHSVDDLFPQRRSNSPSRYDAAAATKVSQQPEIETPFSGGEGVKEGSGFVAMLKDATLGAFLGGSAAALTKSIREHDEHLGHPSSRDAEPERTMEDDDGLGAQPAATIPGRPTAEETRLMQEQDAQDAVDSWCTPARPKKIKSKKGKKRGESLEVSESPPTIDSSRQASNEQQIADADHEAPAASGEKTRSFLDHAALTTESKQAVDDLQSESVRREIGTGVSWQTALTTSKDSKGKKRKNKTKDAYPWDDKTALPHEIAAEQLSNPPVAAERGLETKDSIVKDTPVADLDAMEPQGTMPIHVDTPRGAEALPTTDASEEFPTSTRKNKVGMKKNQQSSYSETTETVTPEELVGAPLANEPEALALDVPAQFSNTPHVPFSEGIGPASSLSNAVPYESPRLEEIRPEAPIDRLLPTERPLSFGAELEPDLTVEPRVNLHDTTPQSTLGSPVAEDPPAHHVLEKEAAPAAEPTGKDSLPIQGSETASLQSQVLPENVPLPLSDDLDLTQPPPDSPIIQPIDAAVDVEASVVATGEKFEASDLKNEPTVRSISVLDSPTPGTVGGKALSDSEVAPSILAKAISELNLQRAIADKNVESAGSEREEKAEVTQEQPEDEWPIFSPKKKGPKSISSEAESEQVIVELQSSNADEATNADEVTNRTSNDFPPARGQGLPAEQAYSERDVSKPQLFEVQEAEQVNDRHETVSSIAKPSSEGGEQDVDWPTAIEKTRGEKDKKVQFDEPEELRPQQPEASAAREPTSAVTGIAKAVGDLLHAFTPGRTAVTEDRPLPQEASTVPQPSYTESQDKVTVSHEQPKVESSLEPKKPLGQDTEAGCLDMAPGDPHSTHRLPLSDTLAAAVVHRSGDVDRAPSEEYGQPFEGATASTSTAAEIQNMLVGDKEGYALPATGQDAVDDPVQPTENDDFNLGPYKKKKKGKKSKSADEAVTAAVKIHESLQREEPIQEELPVPKETSASEPIEEISVKKSKKAKKIKRKGFSRSASDIQEEESQSTPLAEEPIEEMAISNDAPSIVEKTDKLAPIEMPTTPEAAKTEVLFDPIAVDEPRASIKTIPETAIEAMERTAKVPSITQKHGELPALEMLTPPEAVRNESSVVDSGRPTSVSADEVLEVPTAEPDNVITFQPETEDTTILVVEGPSTMNPQIKATPDVFSQAPATEDRPLAEEPSLTPVSVDSISISDREAVGQLTKDEATDEATAPVPDEKPAFQPPMGNKNRKKAKKAKGLQREDEFPMSEPGRISHPYEEVSDRTIEPISEAAFGAPAKTKKDRKKSKKVKALGSLGEEPPGSPKAPSEMAKSGGEEHGYDPAVLDNVPLEPAAVVDEETSGSTTISEATGENTVEVEASALRESLPTLSSKQITGPSENGTEMIVPVFEKSSEPVYEGRLPAASDSLPKSKDSSWAGDSLHAGVEVDESRREPAVEDPVKSVIEDSPIISEEPSQDKKSKIETWEDNLPTMSTRFEGAQHKTIGIESEQPTEMIVEDNLEKKSNVSAWEEQEPVAVLAGERQQEILPAEPKSIDERLRDAVEAQTEETETVGDLPDEQATMKKAKNKGKKSRLSAWNDEPSIPPSRDGTDQQFPGSIKENLVAQPLEEIDATKLEVPDIQTISKKSKKSKKRSKKSEFVASDEEPSIPLPSGEKEQGPADSETPPGETASEAQLVGDEESKGNAEASAAIPGSKKDKKEAKKSEAFAWGKESLPSASQDPAGSDPITDIADEFKDPIGSPKAMVHQDMNEPSPNIDAESKQDVGTSQTDEPQAQLFTTPNIMDEGGTVREVTPAPAEEEVVHDDELPPINLDPHPEPTVIPPTENVEVTDASLQALTEDIEIPGYDSSIGKEGVGTKHEPEPTVIPPTENVEVTDASLRALTEDLEIPGYDSSMGKEDIGTKHEPETTVPSPLEDQPDVLVQPSDVHPEPLPAPTIDDALKTTEEVIPPTSSEDILEASPPPTIATTERSVHSNVDLPNTSLSQASVRDMEPEAASFNKDAPEVVGEVVPLQSDGNVRLPSPVPELIPENPDLAAVLATTDIPTSAEENAPTPPQEQVVSDTEANFAEQPAASVLVPEAHNVDVAKEFSWTSKKDKKNAIEATSLEDEAPEDSALNIAMPPTKPGFDSEVLDRAATEEPALVAEPTDIEAVADLPSTSRKGKKAKKNKKSSTFDEDPSGSTTPAEPRPPTEISSEKPALPGDLGTAEDVDEAAFLSKKEKKKAKKAKKGVPWEDEPSTNTTPAEPDPFLETIDKAAEEPVLLTEPDAAEARGEVPATGKKDKRKAKRSKKSIAFGEEPSGAATPTTPVEEVD
ncbi:MAG: hypothetical protein Q9196_001646, partial [Gyalolechia fulgens]